MKGRLSKVKVEVKIKINNLKVNFSEESKIDINVFTESLNGVISLECGDSIQCTTALHTKRQLCG